MTVANNGTLNATAMLSSPNSNVLDSANEVDGTLNITTGAVADFSGLSSNNGTISVSGGTLNVSNAFNPPC